MSCTPTYYFTTLEAHQRLVDMNASLADDTPGREPWHTQPGWQIAVATPRLRAFQLRQMIRRLFK